MRTRAAVGAALVVVALAAPGGTLAARFVTGVEEGYPRVAFDDSLVSVNDRCIVKRNRLSTIIRPVYVNGRPIAFCCTTCPAVFAQDPDPYLTHLRIRLRCAVHPERAARIGGDTRIGLNHEIFYFSDRAAADAFRQDPLRWCGRLTDPVSGERFHPDARSPRVLHRGRPFYFTGEATRARFQAHPDSFAVRTGA